MLGDAFRRYQEILLGNLGLVLGFEGAPAIPEAPETSASTDPAADFLRAFLTDQPQGAATYGDIYGHGHDVYIRTSGSSGASARAILRGGAYELLFRVGEGADAAYLLNLDTPIARLPILTWRKRAFGAASEVGVDLIPVCETAYRRVAVSGKSPRLVQRDDVETVFAIGDGPEAKYYLSGYDQQEDPPLYFLCRLPYAVATIDEARESLKPESVKAALNAGASVLRQGDLFFIETGLDDDDVKLAGKVIDGEPRDRRLYGTAHYADSIAQLPKGVLLAKGTVAHDPMLTGQRRGPDHSPLTLPGWWIAARNTVPAERPLARLADLHQPVWDRASWLSGIFEGLYGFDRPDWVFNPWFPTTSEGGG